MPWNRAQFLLDRLELLAGRFQGAAHPAEGVDGLLEAEAVGVVVEAVGREGLGGQEVREVAEGRRVPEPRVPELLGPRITSYNVCYTKLLRSHIGYAISS